MSTAFTMTASDEEAIISAFFHSDMLNTLLLGIYIPLYFGTMYIYMTRKSSKNRTVLTIITILFGSNVAGGFYLWEDIHRLIGTKEESRSEVLSAELRAFTGPNSAVVEIIFSGLPVILADGLLIWRCFRIWNRSLRIIALSLTLLVAEIALFVAAMVLNLSPNVNLKAKIPPRLTSAGLFTALALTLWTTILIVYRIYSASNCVLDRKMPRFYNILEMIIQSSFIYSLALWVDAMLGVIPLKQSNVWTIGAMSYCIGVILSAITGIAPTIMVAQVVLASNISSDTEPTVIGSSGVQFRELNPNIFMGEGMSHAMVPFGQAESTYPVEGVIL